MTPLAAFIGTQELLIVLVIVVIIFGGAKLPKLARSLGSATKEFKAGTLEGMSDEEAAAKADKAK